MIRLTQLAVARKSVVILVALMLFGVGVVSWGSLKQELIPDIDLPIVAVVAAQPGTGATEIVEQVTAPVEAAIGGVPRLEHLQSTAANGLSLTMAQFDYGTDIDETRTAIDRALEGLQLPEGVQPQVIQFNFNDQPILIAAIRGARETDTDRLAEMITTTIQPALQGIDGVGSVDIAGGTTDRLVIQIDPAALASTGITLQQINGVLQANNLTIPSGQVTDGDASIPVAVVHRFASAAELEGLLVGMVPGATDPATGAPGTPTPVRLGDVASIETVSVAQSGYSRYDDQPALTVSVTKRSEANTVDVADAVQGALDEIQASHADELVITTVIDTSEYIKESRDGLLREGGLGALFAILTILVFLVNIRSTLVAAISIPLSILTAIVVMAAAGISMNILTLGGLAVAVGRVVDDSIVVLENIYRHRSNGDTVREAVIEGTREVAAAITSSTLTTVAVFLPLGFVGGLVSQFFLPFALTVTFALLASLVVAVTIIPVLAWFLIDRIRIRTDEGDTIWQRIYTPILKLALRSRRTKWATLGIAIVLFLGSAALLPSLPTQFISLGSAKEVAVTISPPPGTSSEQVLERSIEVEAAIRAQTTPEHVQITVPGEGDSSAQSLAAIFGGGSSNAGRMVVTLADDADVAAEQQRLNAALQVLNTDGFEIQVSEQSMGVATGGLSVVVSGSDPDAVRAATDVMMTELRQFPDLQNLGTDLADQASEVHVAVDPNKAIATGLTTAQVAGEIRSALVPQRVARVQFDSQRPLDLYVQLGDASTITPETLAALPVGPTATPLGQLATVERVEQQATVTRIDQSLAATVTADIVSQDEGAVSAAVQTRIDELEAEGRLPDVSVGLAGITEQMTEAFGGMFFAMAVAIILVYLVMMVVFNSLIDPFIILFSLPLATIGAFVALFVTGRAIGVSALIGFLMLIGIVVTNAIVLLDLVGQLRRKGMSPQDALMEGARTRVRPILMTALATILALMPIALGFNEGSVIAADLGTVVIGGLISSTALTLIVIPVIYSLVEGGRRWFRPDPEGGTDEPLDPGSPAEAVMSAQAAPLERAPEASEGAAAS